MASEWMDIHVIIAASWLTLQVGYIGKYVRQCNLHLIDKSFEDIFGQGRIQHEL